MPGELLPMMANVKPLLESNPAPAKPDMNLYLIVSTRMESFNQAYTKPQQSTDDIVYEQDILRDPAGIKPWLSYIDYKHQHGTLLELSFVSETQI